MAPPPRFRRAHPSSAMEGPVARLEDAVDRYAKELGALLGGGLTFAEHFKAAEVVGSITVPSTTPWPEAERPQLLLPEGFTATPRQVLVVDARKKEDSSLHYSLLTAQWERVAQGARTAIRFHSVENLAAGAWLLTIIVLA